MNKINNIIRICEYCGVAYLVPPSKNARKRLTCSTKCLTELRTKNRKKEEILINGRKLNELVKETVTEIGGDLQSVRSIVRANKSLLDNDSKVLRQRIANVLKYELGYVKVSPTRYKKLF